MKPELQRIAIHEALGWQKVTQGSLHYAWKRGDEFHYVAFTPNYLNSLDAMHEAEKALTETQFQSYLDWLDVSCGGELALSEMIDGPAFGFGLVHATASQRAEAFLRTLNLWQE